MPTRARRIQGLSRSQFFQVNISIPPNYTAAFNRQGRPRAASRRKMEREVIKLRNRSFENANEPGVEGFTILSAAVVFIAFTQVII
jgi:hypothetical protein